MSDRETTKDDGAPCALCGDDAVWIAQIKQGTRLEPMALCGLCSDEQTTLCPGCDRLILQSHGMRIYSTPDLYCRSCGEQKETAIAAAQVEYRRDVERDDFSQTRR